VGPVKYITTYRLAAYLPILYGLQLRAGEDPFRRERMSTCLHWKGEQTKRDIEEQAI
jgi:hypothetical protein